MGKIIVYGEMAQRIGKREVEVQMSGKTVLEILKEFTKEYGVEDLLFKNDKIRPIYLILIDGKDFLSLGLLNQKITEEKEIKIIPTFHGG